MAQDSMRTGPEGASPQAAKLKKRVVQLHTTSAVANDAGAEAAITAAVRGPAHVSGILTKASAIRNLYVFPGMNGVDTYGGEYIVTKLWVQNSVEFATNPVTVNVGIYVRSLLRLGAAGELDGGPSSGREISSAACRQEL
jgi:hypothetical protein